MNHPSSARSVSIILPVDKSAWCSSVTLELAKERLESYRNRGRNIVSEATLTDRIMAALTVQGSTVALAMADHLRSVVHSEGPDTLASQFRPSQVKDPNLFLLQSAGKCLLIGAADGLHLLELDAEELNLGSSAAETLMVKISIIPLSSETWTVDAKAVTWDELSPSCNGQRHAMWKDKFVQNGSIFVHLPKCAGSSIEKDLYDAKKQTQHSTLAEWRKMIPDADTRFFKYTIVRHPLKRYLSGFRYIMSRDKASEPDGEAFQTVHLGFRMLKENFGACPVRYLEYLATFKTREDWSAVPVHFRPQSYFLDNFNCAGSLDHGLDFVGRMENLKEDFENLLNAHDFGRHPDLTHERSTPMPPEHAGLPRDPAFQALIKKVYARDFEMFDYE